MAISPVSVTLSYLSHCPTCPPPSKTTRTTKTQGTSMPLRVGGMPSGGRGGANLWASWLQTARRTCAFFFAKFEGGLS